MNPPSTTHQPPPTKPGWVNTFYRYHKGHKLGPYYVRRWKVGNQIKKEYIKPADVDQVKAACQAHREENKRRREAAKADNVYIDNWNFLIRMLFRLQKGPIRPELAAHVQKIHREGCSAPNRPRLRRILPFMVPFPTKRDLQRTAKYIKSLFKAAKAKENAPKPQPPSKTQTNRGALAWF